MTVELEQTLQKRLDETYRKKEELQVRGAILLASNKMIGRWRDAP